MQLLRIPISGWQDRTTGWHGHLARVFLAALLSFGMFSALMTGCAGYQVGARSLYAPDIQTVYVPIFESSTFRRNMGEQLTEAVVKQIELKTHFKVVGSPNADSILTGRIVEATKDVVVTSSTDEARETLFGLVVEVRWVNRRGELLRDPRVIPLPPEVVISQEAPIVPEAGQSVASAQMQAVDRLAEQIVSTMELPW